jgi:hypothetical protein
MTSLHGIEIPLSMTSGGADGIESAVELLQRRSREV